MENFWKFTINVPGMFCPFATLSVGESYFSGKLVLLVSPQVEGPCVLQIQKIRNVAAPKDHEESQGAPRMLRIQMTDGHTNCAGIEFKHLSKIRYCLLPPLVLSGLRLLDNVALIL